MNETHFITIINEKASHYTHIPIPSAPSAVIKIWLEDNTF
jgi:hypothetical protein